MLLFWPYAQPKDSELYANDYKEESNQNTNKVWINEN